jgi:uncharacterized protein YrrD
MSAQKPLVERASELIGRPVVTLAGDDVAEVKDVVLGTRAGELAGLTLNNRGMLKGPMHRMAEWDDIHALGADAVLIADERDLDELADDREAVGPTEEVTGLRVLTDDGNEVGAVTDAIVRLGRDAELVGYVIETGPHYPPAGRELLVRYDMATAVSDQAMILPEETSRHVAEDLVGFTLLLDREGGSSHEAA